MKIDCNSCPILKGVLSAFSQGGGKFIDNGDGTVTDTRTGLIWQQKTAPGEHTWEEAVKYCETLELGSHEDWRLPSIRELQSIVDYGRYDPAIDPVFSAELSWYWSSSSYVNFPNSAWFVDFNSGYVHYDYKYNHYYVRAVRGKGEA